MTRWLIRRRLQAWSCLNWVAITGSSRRSIVAVTKSELLAVEPSGVALGPFAPLCPGTSSTCREEIERGNLQFLAKRACELVLLSMNNLMSMEPSELGGHCRQKRVDWGIHGFSPSSHRRMSSYIGTNCPILSILKEWLQN